MDSAPYPRRPMGRGQSFLPALEMWENRPGRIPGPSIVRRDPVSGFYKLHVKSIPPDWNKTILRNIFRKSSEPVTVYMHPYRGPNTPTWGFVEFETYQEASEAVRAFQNNPLVDFQVSFAREKPNDEDMDTIVKLISGSFPEERYEDWPAEPLVNPRVLTKTVRNNHPYSIDGLIEDYQLILPDQETHKAVEESLFQRILNIYEAGEGPTGKCQICDANCYMACSTCTAVFYCSEACQTKDWALHSQNCKSTNTGREDNNTFYSKGGGDNNRQARCELTNGYKSHDSERESRSNNRPNRDRVRMDQSRNNQPDRSQGKKSLMEERRARFLTSGRRNENDGGSFQSRSGQNNQKSHNGGRAQETRNSSQLDSTNEDENWDTQNEEVEIKTHKQEQLEESVTTREVLNVGVKALGEQLPQPGAIEKVLIIVPEKPGLFFVQLQRRKSELQAFVKTLNEQMKHKKQFSPVKDGVCGIYYEDFWYRCQITNMEPLTVSYVDFGYPEIVEADRLYCLPSELISPPYFALKIKLIDGTTEEFLNKIEQNVLTVKLLEEIDNCWLAEVMENYLTSDIPQVVTSYAPVAVTASAPTEEVKAQTVDLDRPTVANTTHVEQPVVVNQIQEDSPKQMIPKTTQQSYQLPAVSEAERPPFPAIFDVTKFTTVVITYPESSELKDTYYVGAKEIRSTLTDMSKYFKSVIHQCEMETPNYGTMGLAIYNDEWYRVKVVSLSPLLVYYIDCGYTEPLETKGLKKCPETHKDVPPLVHKIKLASDTNQKYFNLPENSEISVKPLSWLTEDTIMVQIEAETDVESPKSSKFERTTPLSPGSTPTSASPYKSVETETPLQPNISTNVDNSSSPSPKTADPVDQVTHPTSTFETASPTTIQLNNEPKKTPSTVDLLKENWKIAFSPNKLDIVKNSLLGQVYSIHIPETLDFMMEPEKFQSFLFEQKFDPNFKPHVGEVVGLNVAGEWERGKLLSHEGLVALNDQGGVIRCAQLFKLPEHFINIPPMAAVLTVRDENPDLISCLAESAEICLCVTKVNSYNGHTVVHVVGNVLEQTLEGELRAWDYEPLETPDPLVCGDLVTISKVLDSNTFLVTSANDLEIEQAIEIDCRKTGETFQTTPKVGDYVAFYDKENDIFFRCRIDNVDKDEYEIYCIDSAMYHQAKLTDLRPLPSTLRNVPCRITQIELDGVSKVDQTEQAQLYISHIVEEDKPLRIDINEFGKATLTLGGEEDTVNNKLKELLKVQVLPDSDGKLNILSLPELGIPLNQEFKLLVSQTSPLYVQSYSHIMQYYTELHPIIQTHCEGDDKPYNPCESELCLAKFCGEWYRCRCLKETNQGMSSLMLVDYGNMFNVETNFIRRILPELLTMPSLAISCRIQGLPKDVSPTLRTRLDQLLAVDTVHQGIFVAENDDRCYEVVIESVKKDIEGFQ